MSQKQIVILVAVIFSLVAVGALINARRVAEIGDRLTQISAEQLASVSFYKDPLRDSEGLDLPMQAPADLADLVAALHTLRPSNVSMKTLEIVAETKIAVQLVPEDKLMIRVIRAKQMGEVGVVSVMREAGIGEVPGGEFESTQLLAWVESMAARPGFERIVELRAD